MKFIDIIRMCLRSLTKRKARTILTVSGVVIGTCAIIVMISLGVGMDAAQRAMISEWADLTMVEVYNYGGVKENGEQIPAITDDVVKSFQEVEHVKAATPIYQGFSLGYQFLMYNDEFTVSSNLIGVYMDQLDEFGYTLSEGQWKTEKDGKYAVVLGEQVGSYGYNYYDEEDVWAEYDEEGNIISLPIDLLKTGMTVIPLVIDPEYWGEPDYTVIDSPTAPNRDYAIELKPVGRLKGNWNDYYTMDGILIDIAAINDFVKAYNELNSDSQLEELKGEYDNVRIRVDDMDNVAAVEEAIKEMGYQTYSNNQLRDNMKQQTQTIQLMLGALAAVSLFVAALNITNTMIMSIIERTKEIGIMKVLGCDISKIRMQFLGEAALIGFIGGVVGTGLSYLVSYLLNSFLAETLMQMMGGSNGYTLPEGTDISVIPPWLILLGVAFATVIGLASGFYPANRSVKISALSAITHE